jgi:hypothetical protein
MGPVASHTLAIAAAVLALVAAAAGWIVNLRAGPRLGLEAGAIVVIVPLAMLVLFAMWLVVRTLLARVRRGALGMTAVCAMLTYTIVAVACGPITCFQAGPHRAMGWFLVGGVAAAALVHHVVLGRLAAPRAD